MRFVKVFLLFALFAFSVLFISGGANYVHRKVPVIAFGGVEEAAAAMKAFQESARIVRSDRPEDEARRDQALEDCKRFIAKVAPAAKAVRILEYVAYVLLAIFATLFYLRSNRLSR